MENFYALNSQEELVYALDSRKSDGDFFCPSCKGRMGIKKGKIKVDHFFHINKECSEESYLHKTAKTMLYTELKKNIGTSKKIEFYLNSHNIDKSRECIKNIKGNIPIKTNNDRVGYVIKENLLNFLYQGNKAQFQDLLYDFFSKVKETKDKKLISIFVTFHKWLLIEIDKSVENNKNKLPKNFSKTWNKIKQKNSLVDNILLIDKYMNKLMGHTEYKSMQKFFEKISEEQKELIIKYFYIPAYERVMKVDKVCIDIGNIKDIYFDNKYYKGFLADILTFDNNNEPIFWEIAVSHKCEDAKIDCGIKTIEISIADKDELKILSNFEISNLIIDGYNF